MEMFMIFESTWASFEAKSASSYVKLSKDCYLKFSWCKLNFTQQHLWEDILCSKSATDREHFKSSGSRVN
jgi:hypothetical protein